MKSYELVPNAGIREYAEDQQRGIHEVVPLTLRPSPGAPPVTILRPGSVRDGILLSCGLYYIQEPSAMAPVELLGVTSGIWCWTCARLPAANLRRLRRS